MPHSRYTNEEIVRRGQDLYERQIRPHVETGHGGEFLVLDVDTGDFETDRSETAALKRAKAKNPDAALYILKIGAPTAFRIGLLPTGK